jgi:hypothetical protein
MKNLSILVLIGLFTSSISAAEVVVPIESVEKHVNIRFAADAKSEIVGRLRQGDHAVFVKSVPGWHQVELQGGGTGFIHEDWCHVIGEAPAVAEAVPAPVAEPAVESTEPVAITDEVDEAPPEDTVSISDVESELAPDEAVEEELVVDVIAHPVGEEVESVESEDEVIVANSTGPGIVGPAGPPGPPGSSAIEGTPDYLMKFTSSTMGGSSQVYDDGRNVGIGTTEPKQRLEVNGNIQIHERNANVVALMLTQSDGDTGYIMHNRANTLTIGAGSVDRITIDGDGFVGIGTSRPTHPIEMASGAFVTEGGVWTNSSSFTKKENIVELTTEEAIRVLVDLEPVHFNYIADDREDYIGFIAEDVPDLVATADRTGLSAMDIVAVLTKVVQEQQDRIEALEEKIERNR